MRRSVIAWLCAVAACDGGGSVDPDAAPDADPNCHWDCFGYQECHDGVVTTWENTPVPCQYWEGECPHATSTPCVEGCRIDTATIEGDGDPSIMCEENRPKRVGDVCADDTDCRPEVATWDNAGNVTNVYLRCDVDAGMCVARDAPVVADWLAQCGLVPDDNPGYAYGFREVDTCGGGVCLFYEQNDCVAQGCTIRCESDGECPMGAVCQPDWKVCKPGPPHSIGDDLSCP